MKTNFKQKDVYIGVNDIFDDLREEVNRLSNENKLIFGLLEKYRKISLSFEDFCVCDQKSTLVLDITSTEEEYQRIQIQSLSSTIKKEDVVKTYLNPKIEIIKSENKIKTEKTDELKTKRVYRKRVIKKKLKPIESYDETNEVDSESNDDFFEPKRVKRVYIRRKPKKSPSEKGVNCHYLDCGKQFKCRSLLEVHIRRRHTFIKPFRCESCDKCFYTKLELKSHLFSHSSQKQFQCQHCDKQFNQKQGLYSHIDIYHTDQPTYYKCDYCSFQTKYKGHLKPHMRGVHTIGNEDSVKCDAGDGCDKAFRTKQHMLRHKRYAHSGVVYLCDWPGCGQSFKGKCTYDDHHRSHLGIRQFKCTYEGCDKTFILRKTLFQHKLSHQKKYVCSWPECGQRFSLKPLLTAHQNKHQNIKPFKCEFIGCHKEFYIKPHLNLHIRTEHKFDR